MSPAARTRDDNFRSRARPPGSARYWSHAFAAPAARPALLGVYALTAEWQSLCSPVTEPAVAYLKLAWWQEEMSRLIAGSPLHPVSLYLAALPQAAPPVFEPLLATLQAALLEAGGVPLERADQLQAHASALLGNPWRVAAQLTGDDGARISDLTQALAAAQYRSHALRHYALAARHGRVFFPVDELLADGIENAGLAADSPAPALQAYLARWRARALKDYAEATAALRTGSSRNRHLAVLSALGAAHLRRESHTRPRPLKDMLLAWSAARRTSS
jgi:15-cis-phytoene synthase